MKKQKHKVELTPEERQDATNVSSQRTTQCAETHACPQSRMSGLDRKSEAFGCHERTVSNVRKRFIERGRLESLSPVPCTET